MSDFGRNREAKVGITLGNKTYPSLVASLESPLRQVEALLEDQLSSEDIHVASMLDYVRGLSGKRMRPVLTLCPRKPAVIRMLSRCGWQLWWNWYTRQR